MLEVIATMGIAGQSCRMYMVVETPSSLGMMISIKIMSK